MEFNEFCDGLDDDHIPAVVDNIIKYLELVGIVNNRKIVDGMIVPELFVGNSTPTMTIREYVEHYVTHFDCNLVCHVIAYIYMQRVIVDGVVCHNGMDMIVSQCSIHRIYCIALLIACKYVEDDVFTNTYYAQVGGITLHELNTYEVMFIQMLKYNAYVPLAVLDEHINTMTA